MTPDPDAGEWPLALACHAFLRFRLEVEPDGGPMTLDVTGPDGTRELLDRLVHERGRRE